MLRQFTFTTVRGDDGAGRTGPDALLFLIQDRTTALKLIEALAQGLRQGQASEDSPITVGFTGEMETESEDEAAGATSAADRF